MLGRLLKKALIKTAVLYRDTASFVFRPSMRTCDLVFVNTNTEAKISNLFSIKQTGDIMEQFMLVVSICF